MLTLPTDPDGFNDGTEIETVECPGCGTTGYMAPEHGPHDARIPRCESCVRESLRERLTDRDRIDALDRIQSRGLLPFEDHEGDLITAVDVRRGPPGAGRWLKKLTKIISEDCPECGHDRADRTWWSIWTCESGETVRCRACDEIIREESTL